MRCASMHAGKMMADLGLDMTPLPRLALALESPRPNPARGAVQAEAAGLAEWIGAATPRKDLRVVTFDTTTGGAWAGSAAKAAAKLLRRRGFSAPEQGPGFVVTGTPGPLRDGEEARARAWGAELVSGALAP